MEVVVGGQEVVVKRKRTKRHRMQQQQQQQPVVDERSSMTSPETSTGSTTEEEENMANCLILLAQGGRESSPGGRGRVVGEVYECKTCSRCFGSFQALGGHRASHKKPRLTSAAAVLAGEDEGESNCLSLQLGKPVAPPPAKVHECAVCGAEFSSGQALGGHMRRHRPSMAAAADSSSATDTKKEKIVLSLDLNLPAPPDDVDRDYQKSPEPMFDFAGKPPMVLTASPLVDCYY